MAKAKDDGKTLAIVSYLTWIGLIIAIVLNMDKKNDFAKFHIRQSLLIMIAWLILMFIPVIGWILNIVLLIFWIIGIVGAAQGEKKLIPLFGPLAQDWFKGL